MENVKVVKGRPVYVLKGSQYLEKPDKTRVAKMMYSEDEGVTYIYLKKLSSWYEVVCILIMVALVLFNRMYVHKLHVSVKYNSLVNYYNGKLYLNITADESNSYDIKYTIGEFSGMLKPGESLLTLDVDNPDSNYEIMFSYDTLLNSNSFSVNVSVVNRDYN